MFVDLLVGLFTWFVACFSLRLLVSLLVCLFAGVFACLHACVFACLFLFLFISLFVGWLVVWLVVWLFCFGSLLLIFVWLFSLLIVGFDLFFCSVINSYLISIMLM